MTAVGCQGSPFADALMSADADAVCGAPYGARDEGRVNRRNAYRAREWDTRAGTVELAVPKLRSGSYFPDWLLERRRRAGRLSCRWWRPATAGSAHGGWSSSSSSSA